MYYIIETLFLLPLFSVFVLLFINPNKLLILQKFGTYISFTILIYSIISAFVTLLNNYKYNYFYFKHIYNYYSICTGIDYLIILYDSTFFFIILITFITFVCVLISLNRNLYHYKLLLIFFFTLEFLSIQFFSTNNLLFLYFYFEASIIPTFIIIGLWGTKLRKNIAFYYIYSITGFGSILMLIVNFIFFNQLGTLNTFELILLVNTEFSFYMQLFLWSLLMLCFLIKLPAFLFYNWLLEAHVEAPVEGSVILSGYILKYSIWGIIAHIYLIFPEVTDYYRPYLSIVIGCSVIYSIFSLLRIHDFKKCIAYSSIAHMGIALLGTINNNIIGITGSLLMSYSHSLVSPALFIVAGLLYEKFGTRDIRYIRINSFPLNFYLTLLLLINIGFPGSINFISEIIIFCTLPYFGDLFNYLTICINILINGVFFMWLLTKINFNIITSFTYQGTEISVKENVIFILIITFLIVFGFFPYYLMIFTDDLTLLHSSLRLNN